MQLIGQLIDSHCHFDFDAFAEDRMQVWARCTAAGVSRMIIPGVSIPQWQSLFALVKNQPAWYAAVGVHPWWVRELAIDPAQLARAICEWATQDRCVAVGECGLDAVIETPLQQQELVFRAHLTAACELDLPLIVHARKTHADTLRLLKTFRPARGGVIHAFSGSEEIAREYISLGFCLGIGGTISYERAAKTRATVAAVPLEALILESDAPDMPLAGRQGQRNSPEFLPQLAGILAELRGITVEQIAEQTRRNTEQLFAL
jgi:TatD DNase family protein